MHMNMHMHMCMCMHMFMHPCLMRLMWQVLVAFSGGLFMLYRDGAAPDCATHHRLGEFRSVLVMLLEFAVNGEADFGCVARSGEASFSGMALLVCYMVLMVVLGVNMLIAMMAKRRCVDHDNVPIVARQAKAGAGGHRMAEAGGSQRLLSTLWPAKQKQGLAGTEWPRLWRKPKAALYLVCRTVGGRLAEADLAGV